jgi:hypothetical protein
MKQSEASKKLHDMFPRKMSSADIHDTYYPLIECGGGHQIMYILYVCISYKEKGKNILIKSHKSFEDAFIQLEKERNIK